MNLIALASVIFYDRMQRRPEMAFQQYQRNQITELEPWFAGYDMTRVSVSAADRDAGSPKPGDMIARNPKNHDDKWLVAAQYFAGNFAPVMRPQQ
jgi:hypothetical protein